MYLREKQRAEKNTIKSLGAKLGRRNQKIKSLETIVNSRDAEKEQMKRDLERLNFKLAEYEEDIKSLKRNLKSSRSRSIDSEYLTGSFFRQLS